MREIVPDNDESGEADPKEIFWSVSLFYYR